MKEFWAEAVRVFTKLYKLICADMPKFIGENWSKIQQLSALAALIFAGVLAIELVILLFQRKWKTAAIFGATLVCVCCLYIFVLQIYLKPIL
ncbi:MAG: hypothetical protein RSB47_03450 [Ruthenibacterium sp.]